MSIAPLDFCPLTQLTIVLPISTLRSPNSVAVKHYLRGEEDIYYVDLYHLTKFLPAYGLPAGRSTQLGYTEEGGMTNGDSKFDTTGTAAGLPLPATASSSRFKSVDKETASSGPDLLPARNPPRSSIFDLWPFSAFVWTLTKNGYPISGKKAAMERAKQRRGKEGEIVSHNIPLEITLYLSSYIAALQKRKVIDVPTTNTLLNALNGLVDSLTGLERVLTTPIPRVSRNDAIEHFIGANSRWQSYSIHLWTVTLIYCWALPFQLVATLNWITIPGVAVVTFIFTGFLVAGEEIENPFGFDRNDLDVSVTHYHHRNARGDKEFTCSSITSATISSAPSCNPSPPRLYLILLSGHSALAMTRSSPLITRQTLLDRRSLPKSGCVEALWRSSTSWKRL